MEEKFNARNLSFLSYDSNASKHKNQQFGVELIKVKRRAKIHKKRMLGASQCAMPIPSEISVYVPGLEKCSGSEVLIKFFGLLRIKPSLRIVEQVLKMIEIHSVTHKETLGIIYENQYISDIIEYVSMDYTQDIVRSSTFILCNFVAGPIAHSQIAYRYGAIERILSVLRPSDLIIIDNCLSTLANLVVDSEDHCRFCLDKDLISVVKKLIIDLSGNLNDSVAGSICYLFYSISFYHSVLTTRQATDIIMIFSGLINKYYRTILKEAVEGVIRLCSRPEFIQIVINQGIVESLMEIIGVYDSLSTILRLFSGIIAGEDSQSQYMLDKNVIEIYYQYIDSEDPTVVKEIMFSLGNLACLNKETNSMIISHEIFGSAIKYLTDVNEKIRLDASYFIRYLCSLSEDADKLKMIENDLVKEIQAAFAFPEPQFLENCICACSQLMGYANRNYEVAINFFNLDELIFSLSNLTKHPSLLISKMVETILYVTELDENS